MTRPEGKAENQHYVAKMLLRHFAIEPKAKEPQGHVFDKLKACQFTTAISNIAAERGFYELKDDSGGLSLEPLLTELEGHANTAFEKVRNSGHVGALSAADVWWIATFVAAQRIRVRA